LKTFVIDVKRQLEDTLQNSYILFSKSMKKLSMQIVSIKIFSIKITQVPEIFT